MIKVDSLLFQNRCCCLLCGVRCRVYGLCYGFRLLGVGGGAWGVGFRVQVSGFRVQSSFKGFRV